MVKELSNTACSVLAFAAAREDHLARLPELPLAAARQVIRSLLNACYVVEIGASADDADFVWRDDDDGSALMLRVTETGIARVSETSGGAAENIALFEGSDAGEIRPIGVGCGADGKEDVEPGAILADPGIASFVEAFIRELMKSSRPAYLAAFLRRLDAGGATPGTATSKRERGMTGSQRKIVELCSRPDGATGKELAEGCGWPSIAARATCQKLADRFGYDLHESPKVNGRGISFRMTAKIPAEEQT